MEPTTYRARAFEPAHAANEAYVAALARIVYYWAYPAVHAMAPPHDWVAATSRDTVGVARFVNLGDESVVIQMPGDVPPAHYWTVQIVDAITNVIHQLGSARRTPGGKYLLVGPDWEGTRPDGFIDVLRMPTHVAGVLGRTFTAPAADAERRAAQVLAQLGAFPLSEDRSERRAFDAARAEPTRPPWVDPSAFWDGVEQVLAANPVVGESDAAMADQAHTLIALRHAEPWCRELLDQVAHSADADLHASSTFALVGIDAGNGWRRQEGAGTWKDDWFGRAQAAVIYSLVDDHREVTCLVRAGDADGALLDGRRRYRMRFQKHALPPVDRARGGFWSVTMLDGDHRLLPRSPGRRTQVGTVDLDAEQLLFGADGSLTLHLAHEEPGDPITRRNWLPAPAAPFSLIVRAYVPARPILDGSYAFPDVRRVG
jgi:hypothetical protein